MKVLEVDKKLKRFDEQFASTDGVFYVGHASILVRLNGYRILFDPVVLSAPYGDSWVFYPPQITDPSFFDVDAVVVSHIHQDHYDVEFLKSLSENVKVCIVGGRPSFEADINAKGIKNVTVIEPETVTEILEGVFIFGVLHESNGVDASTIIFNDQFCVYHGNDNYIKPASVEKFLAAGPPIDVACIPYAYIHWYPFLLKNDGQDPEALRHEGDRLIRLYMDDCINITRIMKPQLVIPFGANLVLDDGDAYSDINLAVKTPLEFCEYVNSVAPDLTNVVRPLLAGDYCGSVDGQLEIVVHSSASGSSYRSEANTFLQGRPPKTVNPSWQRIDKEAFLAHLKAKLSTMDDRPNHIIRIDLDYLGERLMLEISCSDAEAKWVKEFGATLPYHHFQLDPIASGEWLNGKRFEEIIGMRRFTLEREPNEYAPDILKIVHTVF